MERQCFLVFIVCFSKERLLIGAGRKKGCVVFSFLSSGGKYVYILLHGIWQIVIFKENQQYLKVVKTQFGLTQDYWKLILSGRGSASRVAASP